MKQFVAYHNVNKMGCDFEVVDEFCFFSNKATNFLLQTVGARVWIISGLQNGKKKSYHLEGVFIPDQVIESEDNNFSHAISGAIGVVFNPGINLNDLKWFPDFLKSQSNFSIGIASINHKDALQYFNDCLEMGDAENSFNTEELLGDIDDIDESFLFAEEGAESYSVHLRRERSSFLIEMKKQDILAKNRSLACEVCGFDFYLNYGELGLNFCEVHHKIPLSELKGSRLTTLEDLVIVCSNCHRMLHRLTPAMSIEFLREIVNKIRSK